jgi:hypothetical protein
MTRYVWEYTDGPNEPLGHEQVTVSTSAVSLPSVPAEARRAIIRTLGQPINYRDDAVDPTDTTGFPLLEDEVYVYNGTMSAFKMIRSSDATDDADVRVAYYG